MKQILLIPDATLTSIFSVNGVNVWNFLHRKKLLHSYYILALFQEDKSSIGLKIMSDVRE